MTLTLFVIDWNALKCCIKQMTKHLFICSIPSGNHAEQQCFSAVSDNAQGTGASAMRLERGILTEECVQKFEITE